MGDVRATIGIAIVGCGTVGGGVATLLEDGQELLRQRIAPELDLRHIVDVDFRHARKLDLDKRLFRRRWRMRWRTRRSRWWSN